MKKFYIRKNSIEIAYYGSLLLLAGILLGYLINNIPLIPTVFEMPDEAGYLWNAAYFLNIDWNEIGKSAFYGYGYSFFLIPAFVLAKTGVELIRITYLINIFFVLGIYIIYCLLLNNLFERKTIWIPVISFIGCMMPYIVTNTYKVICEVCLTFFYSLLILFFYYTLKTRKLRYYLLSFSCAAFIPFIHVRGIIFVGVFFVAIIVDICIKRQIRKKDIIISIGLFLLIYIFFYILKKNNIDYRAQLRSEGNIGTNETNLITINYISKKLNSIIKSGFFNRISSFITRVFYSINATGGMILFIIPYINIIEKKSFFKNKEKEDDVYIKAYLFLFVFSSSIISIIASVCNSMGSSIDYIFYGRYYENTLPVSLVIGLYIWINERKCLNNKYPIVFIISEIVLGVFSCQWIYGYLERINYVIDTNRLTSFSKAIDLNKDNFAHVIFFSILIITILLFTFYLGYKVQNIKVIAPLLLVLFLWNVDSVCIETIQNTALKAENDARLAEYIVNNHEQQKVYFLNDDSYKYEGVKYRMQVLIKSKSVYELSFKDGLKMCLNGVGSGDYVITYRDSEIRLDKIAEYNRIMEGTRFILYQKK